MTTVELQSKEHRDLLDIIDRLRSQGISKYVDLPGIIVCGDQSAGKSSVLEAISGMSFPTKDNLCTRFPTELVLRRDPASKIDVSIIPGPERSGEEKEYLCRFPPPPVDWATKDLGPVIESAKEKMGLSGAKAFSTDTLRIELSGPTQPHLTLVDLPGLFRAGNKEQSVADAETVEKMVQDYMKRPRSIILAVISAKSDFALQNITELAHKWDPERVRTIGLITKPDTLEVGSESELSYLKLAQNKDVELQLGWHVLRNRNFHEKESTLQTRNQVEEQFFSQGIWKSLDSGLCGAKSLKVRLSNVLKDQIISQLSGLLQDVRGGIVDCEAKLERLGSPRETLLDQRRYLSRIGQDFSNLMKAAVNGAYEGPFFGGAKTEEGYRKRLRAVVQNRLTEFAEGMRERGHTRHIQDDPLEDGQLDGPVKHHQQNAISRSAYVEEVKGLMSRSRGRELPGTFNPLIISELFVEQSQPWKDLTAGLNQDILESVHDVVRDIVVHVAAEETANAILRFVDEGIESLKEDLDRKLDELLDPHYSVHPISYNHYLTDTVQKAQHARRKRANEATLVKSLGLGYLDRNYALKGSGIVALLDSLGEGVQADMDQFGCSLAVDYMQAYYKVALKKFVDNVSVLAIEQCLMQKLPDLFSPAVVLDLSDEDISHMAAESEEASAERARYIEKRDVLQAALPSLARLTKRRSRVAVKPLHIEWSSLAPAYDIDPSSSRFNRYLSRSGSAF
ncbi:interferon-induced GTP-binding protein Mx [Sodiomyces alkalinus F11]|uniref:Interferon-induced GTP-binding protein Mx n=1 Tax=Sodiomyces alkalinus (strain CBS 110278 / VKM F-3762 / F11) TaxID=1314773 RepID=A0A3N2Q4Y6_SODAK|nr:interferon-induced GTP-binding protein Mx [Sodiomyces alkalinus F11]ROT41718.1 interferon-induced GTP-binding protein Mx [Sodiomyces alkalinus F11]